jgi:hypothetical protein
VRLAAAGAAFLNATLKAAAGVSVLYYPKGSVVGLALTAVTGQEARDLATQPAGNAVRVNNRERDYLIVLADLIAASGETVALPAEGDRIVETINEAEVTFEVSKRNGEPCWRWSDRERTRLRVHTKQVGSF